MKCLGRYIDKEGKGYVTLLPEQSEDMWHAYNILSCGDQLKATTIRRVQSESCTGSVDSMRIRTVLTIQIVNIEFDSQNCIMRVNGRNIEENQYVKMGAYHTIDLELNRKFTVSKDLWDSVALDRVEIACDVSKSADVAAVVMQEGLANLCLVSGHMTHVKSRIEVNIPRKRRGGCTQHDIGVEKFFEYITRAILQYINFEVVKAVIVASPGFLNDAFLKHLFSYAVRSDCKVLMENKSKFILCRSSTGHKYSLAEVLTDGSVLSRLQDTKATAEIKALDSFYQMLNNEPDRAFYGYQHVCHANEKLAIDTLLITDELFRSSDIATRKKYVSLVEDVKNNRGTVHIFSSMHVSGEQLTQLSGIAAILRFPLPEIDEEDMEVGN